MRNSFVKINKNDILFCGRSNYEIGIFVRYKAICDNFETDTLTWEQICSNFTPKERKVVSKFFRVEQKISEDETKISKNKQKISKISPEKDIKNKDLICARVYNNIPDQTRLDQTRPDYKGGEPPNKTYAFDGKVIKLKQKDFDAWKLAYPDLNLRAELMQRDDWLAEQPEPEQKRWFISTGQYFIRRNEYRKAQNAEIAEQFNNLSTVNDDGSTWSFR